MASPEGQLPPPDQPHPPIVMEPRRRQIPSPRENGNQLQLVRHPRHNGVRDVECKTARELRRCPLVKKAAGVFREFRDTSSLVRTVADKVEERSQALCLKVIRSKTGRKADKILARVTREAQHSIEEGGKVREIVVNLMHTAFRYCPPTLLIRWGVDIALGVFSATLALMKDVHYVQRKMKKEKIVPEVDIEVVYSQYIPAPSPDGIPNNSNLKDKPGTSDEAGEIEVVDDEESVMEEINIPDYSMDTTDGEDESGYLNGQESYWDKIMDKLEAGVDTMTSLMFWVFMPLTTVVTIMLFRVSNQLHSWAGMTKLETPTERSERIELFTLLVETKEEDDQDESDDENAPDGNGCDGDDQVDQSSTENSQDENSQDENGQDENQDDILMLMPRQLTTVEVTWLFDAVVDRQVGYLKKFFIIGKLLDLIGIQRPFKIAEKIEHKLNQLQRKKSALMKYLEEDTDYDDDDDPDYQPIEDDQPAEDSLEYREEELEPENETDTDEIPKSSDRHTKEMTSASSTPKENTGHRGTRLTKQPLSHLIDDLLPLEVKQPISPLLSPRNFQEKGPISSTTRSGKDDRDKKTNLQSEINVCEELNEERRTENEEIVQTTPETETQCQNVDEKVIFTETVTSPGCKIRGILIGELTSVHNDKSRDLDPQQTVNENGKETETPGIGLQDMTTDSVTNTRPNQSCSDDMDRLNVDDNITKKIRTDEINDTFMDTPRIMQDMKMDEENIRFEKTFFKPIEPDNNIQSLESPHAIITPEASGVTEKNVTPDTPRTPELNADSKHESQDDLALNDRRLSSNVDTGQTASAVTVQMSEEPGMACAQKSRSSDCLALCHECICW